MKLLIFNPEHDLCLANGSADFVPPQSAVDYACSSSAVMQSLYPDGLCRSAYDDLPAEGITEVVAWGWNVTLKKRLLKAGIPESLLPSDEELSCWRALQHRQTVLPLQPDAHRIESAEQVERLLASQQKRWVLKAPWSGAGRGLHWIDGTLTPNDKAWLQKMLHKSWTPLLKQGGRVFIGEFGSHNRTPHQVALDWLDDNLSVFKQNDWGWALWNLSGSFGIMDSDRQDVDYEDFHGHKLDRKMLNLLLKHN